jgi:hypothetical protein
MSEKRTVEEIEAVIDSWGTKQKTEYGFTITVIERKP